MKNKAQLIFSNDGSTAYILFASGGESLEFENKEEAIYSIKDCYDRNLITESEMESFLKQIVLSEKMLSVKEKVPFLIFATIAQLAKKREEKISDPYVEMCKCECKIEHAYLYNRNGKKISPPIMFKNDGLIFSEYLLQSERITEKESATLNALINLLPLPEDAILN